VYVASISAAAKDSGGLALGASYTWSFTTAADSAPPTVVSTSPVELATGVPLTSKPSAKFSRAMDPATLDATTFSLMQGATVIEGNVALNPATTTATFSPTVPLDTSLVYKATITTAAQDLGGLALVSDYTWTFETAASAAAPTVVATSPVDQATNVPLDTEPSATFSQSMDPGTLNGTTFTVKQGTSNIAGSVTLDAATNTATFIPSAPLRRGLVYTGTITTGVQDRVAAPRCQGAALTEPYLCFSHTALRDRRL